MTFKHEVVKELAPQLDWEHYQAQGHLCKTCDKVIKSKYPLRVVNDQAAPSFCSGPCAIKWIENYLGKPAKPYVSVWQDKE